MLLHAVPDLRAEGTAETAVWKYSWDWDSAGLALFLASEKTVTLTALSRNFSLVAVLDLILMASYLEALLC